MRNMENIRIAIAGVGNCASSLVQGRLVEAQQAFEQVLAIDPDTRRRAAASRSSRNTG